MKNYQKHWTYQRIKELGYKVRVTRTAVNIYFPDGDLYARFKLRSFDFDEEKTYFIYVVGNNGEQDVINELDYNDTYDEAVSSCFYYFLTRF